MSKTEPTKPWELRHEGGRITNHANLEAAKCAASDARRVIGTENFAIRGPDGERFDGRLTQKGGGRRQQHVGGRIEWTERRHHAKR